MKKFNNNLEGTQGEESNNVIRLSDRLEKIFIPANSLYNLEYKEGKWSINLTNTNNVKLGVRETSFDWSYSGKKWTVNEDDTGVLAEIMLGDYFTMTSSTYTFYFY